MSVWSRQRGEPDFTSIERKEDARELAFEIAKQFQRWLKEKQETTDDKSFRMVINFVLMVDDYRKFRMALNTGDVIMIEKL